MKGQKNPMHIGDKHPFEISGKNGGRGKSLFGRGAGAHPTAAGVQGKFRSANASMKGK